MTTVSSSLTPPQNKSKTIGILGGMGPLASAEFLQKLLACIPAARDWEYPRIILDSNTHIPSRSRACLYGEASPLPGMIAACKQLERYAPSCIAVPCNSAQAWLTDLQAAVETPILNIFTAVVEKLQREHAAGCPVVVLGGPVTYGLDTYKPYVEKAGFSYHKIDEKEQKMVAEFIEAAKKMFSHGGPEYLKKLCINIIDSISCKFSVKPVFIFGCTEFGLIADSIPDHRGIDSSDEYARYVAQYICTKKEENRL